MLSPADMHRLAELSARLDNLTDAEAVEWHQLNLATIPKAIEPYYSLVSTLAIPLYAGSLIVPSRVGDTPEHVDGTVSLQLMPQPHVLMSATVPRPLIVQHLLDGTPDPQLPRPSGCRIHPARHPTRATRRGLYRCEAVSWGNRQPRQR